MEKDTAKNYESTDSELDSRPRLELDAITEALGFLETPDLVLIRQAIVEVSTVRGDTDTARELLAQYQAMSEVAISAIETPRYSDMQIGLIVVTAAIRLDIGNIGAAIDDLEDALIYAQNMGQNELASRLQDIIAALEGKPDDEPQSSRELAEAMAQYEDYGFDPETRDEIAAMPFDEAFETVYGYLTQAGLDADEILGEFTQPE